jgi:fucose permease
VPETIQTAEEAPPASPPRATAYRRDRRTLAAFGLLAALGALQVSIGAVLPYLRAEPGLSYAAASLHLTAFAAAGVPTAVTAAAVQRRISRLGLVALGALGMVVGVGVIAAAGSTVASLTGAALLGAAAVWAFVGLWSALSDQHGERRAIVLSEGEAAVSAGTLALPLMVASAQGAGAGWRAGLLTTAGVAGLMLVAVRLAGGVEEGMPRASEQPLALRQLWPLLAAVACCVGFEWTLTTWMATHLHEGVHLQRETAVALSSTFFCAMLAGRLLTSRLARHFSARSVLIGALFAVVTALPLLLATASAAVATLGLVLTGAATGALFPLASALVLAAAGRASTRASGTIMLLAAIAVLAAPLAVGGLAELVGLRTALVCAAALPITTVGLVLSARRSGSSSLHAAVVAARVRSVDAARGQDGWCGRADRPSALICPQASGSRA